MAVALKRVRRTSATSFIAFGRASLSASSDPSPACRAFCLPSCLTAWRREGRVGGHDCPKTTSCDWSCRDAPPGMESPLALRRPSSPAGFESHLRRLALRLDQAGS
eukprot:scaffold2710_cov204-Pinguiococcus_pyrenoidosus.AAC.2